MPDTFTPRVVVITGASSGIGRASAEAFARQRGHIVLTARRGQPLEEAAERCRALGGQAVTIAADVRNPDDMEAVAALAVEQFKRIDVWVNNAAVMAFGGVEQIPLEVFQEVMDVNWLGVVNGSRAVLPQFRKQSHGVLINVAAVDGRVSQPFTAPYSSSKHAVLGFTDALRQELRHTGIRVCSVLPPSTDTPLFEHAANFSGKRLKPSRTLYSPEQVARTIVRLAEHPRREAFVGPAERALDLLRRTAPGLAEKMRAKQAETSQFREESQVDERGNIFEPMERGTGLHGEERTGSDALRDGEVRSGALGAWILLPLVAGTFLLRRLSR
jgi:short-subunit dehydrogenase